MKEPTPRSFSEGKDLRNEPLSARRKLLAEILKKCA
jgi:ATP-dependent DNA ligase